MMMIVIVLLRVFERGMALLPITPPSSAANTFPQLDKDQESIANMHRMMLSATAKRTTRSLVGRNSMLRNGRTYTWSSRASGTKVDYYAAKVPYHRCVRQRALQNGPHAGSIFSYRFPGSYSYNSQRGSWRNTKCSQFFNNFKR